MQSTTKVDINSPPLNRNIARRSTMNLSRSPTSIINIDDYGPAAPMIFGHIPAFAAKATKSLLSKPTAISVAELIDTLPSLLRLQKENAARVMSIRVAQDEARGTSADPIMDLFGRLDLNCGEWWKHYAHSDPMKNYTRNLIATDDETFTLLLLCWNPGKESPIHDHPCDGCWVRVCEGKILETRYEIDSKTDKLEMTSETVFEDSAPTFINDSMGYHKIGNPGCEPALSLHLYCPPIKECTIWLDPSDASLPSTAVMCNYTEYGVKKNVDPILKEPINRGGGQ